MPYVPYSVWPNVCTQSGHLAAIKHYKSPIASLIYERPLVGSFKVYHALLGLISFTRYGAYLIFVTGATGIPV